MESNMTQVFPALQSVLLALVCLPLVLGGCTMAPKYIRPDAPVPGEYHKGAGLYGSTAEFLS